MSSAATLSSSRAAATAAESLNAPLQIIALSGIHWDQYVAIADALPDRAGLRVTYDGETLELMTTSRRHEKWKEVLGRLIEQLTLQLNIPLESGGQTTFRDKLIEKGLEPDRCYWIQHADEILGVGDWKAGRHPPPDIAVEIDVASSSVNRQEIYASLGIPELWRFDGERLIALQLKPDGRYERIEVSLCLPFLRVADLEPFLTRDPPVTETALLREFVHWIDEQGFARA